MTDTDQILHDLPEIDSQNDLLAYNHNGHYCHLLGRDGEKILIQLKNHDGVFSLKHDEIESIQLIHTDKKEIIRPLYLLKWKTTVILEKVSSKDLKGDRDPSQYWYPIEVGCFFHGWKITVEGLSLNEAQGYAKSMAQAHQKSLSEEERKSCSIYYETKRRYPV